MNCSDCFANPRIGKSPNPALTGPKRFGPSPDAADNQDIDHAGNHERGSRLLGRMLNRQELSDITDEDGGLIGVLCDVNNFRQ